MIVFKNFSNKLIINLAYLVFFAVIFISAVVPIDNFDTWFHLATGKYIVSTHSIPLYDIFSYTAFGARWIAHYWLSGVLFYLSYLLGGFWFLIIFVALIAASTFGFLIATAKLRLKNLFLPLILSVLFIFFSARLWHFWVARGQIFGCLFAAILIYLFEKWRVSGNLKVLFWLFPTFILWANTHASVVLGIMIALLYSGIYILKNLSKPKDVFLFLVLVFASLLATFINPNGYRILTYGFDISQTVKELGIFEWQSIIFYLFGLKATIQFGFVLLVGFFLIFLIIRNFIKNKVFEWEWLGLTLAAVFLPILSVRHIGFFAILTLPPFAVLLSNFLLEKNISLKIFEERPTLFFVLGSIILLTYIFSTFPIQQLDYKNFPIKAADFIAKEKIPGPIFNNIVDGDYFMWALWPEYKVFFDGRSEIYAGQASKDYQTIMKVKEGWQYLIDNKYKINLVVLSPIVPAVKGQPVRTDLVLAKRLVEEKDFKLVYWDDAAMILVRNIPQNKTLIEKYGYSIIGPYVSPQYISSQDAKKAALEIKRAIEISPDSSLILRYAKEFLTTH
jgi:hypothetical protein